MSQFIYSGTGGGTPVVPGGATTNVQYNDAGAFGGDANFTWNKSTKFLTVNGDIRIANGSGITSLGAGQLGFVSTGSVIPMSLLGDGTTTTLSVIGAVAGASLIVGNGNLSKNITLSHNGTNPTIAWATGSLQVQALPTSNAGLASGCFYTTAGAVMQVP